MDIVAFKRIFGILSLEEKLETLHELMIRKGELGNELDSLAEEFTVANRNFNVALSSDLNKSIENKINGKFDEFKKGYTARLQKAKKELDLVNKELVSLQKDERIQKAMGIKRAYNNVRKAYISKAITFTKQNDLIKAVTGDSTVKYADNIVFNQKGEILLLKRSIWEDTHKGAWVIPGGHVDPGESFEQAAKRELLEESGFNATNPFKHLGIYKDGKVEIHYFICYIDTTEQASIIDHIEVRDLKWVKLDELEEYEMVFNMKDNIKKMLNIKPNPITVIKKAIQKGLVPTTEMIEKAKQTPTQSDKISLVMGEFKRGELKSSSGAKVTDRKQALAIAMSEAGISKSEDGESEGFTSEQLTEMITEHERLIKNLESIKNPSKRIKEELKVQREELSNYQEQLKELEKYIPNTLGKKAEIDEIEKAKDVSKLIKRKKLITRGGKTFLTTYYEKPDGDVERVVREKEVATEPIHKDVKTGVVVKIKSKRLNGNFVVEDVGYSHSTKREFYTLVDIHGETKQILAEKLTSLEVIDDSVGSTPLKSTPKRDTESIPTYSLLTNKIKVLGGSSGVELWNDVDGELYAVKKPHKGDINQLKQEVFINDIYASFGFETPEGKVDEKSGKLVSRYISGAKELNSVEITPELKKEIQKGFVLDALLANWDVLGSAKDNILIKDGKVIRIDNGGTLSTRAKGGTKEFGRIAREIDTLRDYDPGEEIFDGITDDEIVRQIKEIDANKSKFEKIKELPDGESLHKTLMDRIGGLRSRYGVEETGATAPKSEKKEPTEKLRADMPSLVTQKYFDNEFKKCNIEGNKGIKEHIAKKILKFEKKWQDDYERLAKREGISVDQLKENMQKMVTGIIERSHGYIVAHSSGSWRGEGVIGKVIEGGRFKTQFETGTSMGALSGSSRSRTEKGFYGFDPDTEKAEMRPIYGFFTDQPNGAINHDGKIPPPRKVDQYGDVCFQVKDSKWRKDATFTLGDSLGDQDDYVSPPVGAPHFTALKPNYYEEMADFYHGKVDGGVYGGYVESQYHNQLKLEDIEKVHISVDTYSTREKLTKVINEINEATLKGGKLVSIEMF